MSEHVPSETFVGRFEERQTIEAFLEKADGSRILCIHSDGKGGLGKTRLLAKVREEYSKKENILCTELIDFYQLEVQRPIGLGEKLSEQLGCITSCQSIKAHRRATWGTEEEKKAAGKEIIRSILKEYYTVASDKTLVVFFFDSYEHIQLIENNIPKPTKYSNWLESELIPWLLRVPNARLILAGRYQPASTSFDCQASLCIKPFSQAISKKYLQRCLQESGELAETELKELHRLTEGHPILLALAADWLRHADTQEVEKFLAKEAKKDGKDFKNELIAALGHQIAIKEKDSLLPYVTIACLRLDADILHLLTGKKIADCKEYIDEIRAWAFVKPKGDDAVILHDVMRSFLEEYLQYEDPLLVKENTEKLIKYYEKKIDDQRIAEEEQEKYILEMVAYAFRFDLERGVDCFCDNFDHIMEDGRYDFAANFLLRETEECIKKERIKKETFKTLNFLKVAARRIEYETEGRSNHQYALEIADNIIAKHKDDEKWKNSYIEGLILLKRGTALFGLARFTEAVKELESARKILLDNDASSDAHWCDNWTGYSYYNLGDFVKAEKILDRSRENFYNQAESVLVKTQIWDTSAKNKFRRIVQGYQIALVNLSLIYFSTGRLYEAAHHARIYYHIVQDLINNDREIARAQATLSLTSWFMGYRDEARAFLEDALQRSASDPLISARIRTEQLRQKFHGAGLLQSSFLEYYRAEEFRGKIEDIRKGKSFDQELSDIEKTVQQLEEKITKELFTAYFVQANLSLLKLPEIGFATIEGILQKGLQEDAAQKGHDKLRYEKARCLSHLVRLCYFATAWDRDSLDAQLAAEKLDYYLEKFAQICKEVEYPELAARCNIVSGNVAFDKAIQEIKQPSALEHIQKAVACYLNAAKLVQRFKRFRHLPFHILRDRLAYFIEQAVACSSKELISADNYESIRNTVDADVSENIREYFHLIFDSTKLCLPATDIKKIQEYDKKIESKAGEKISVARKVVQIKSLADAYGIRAKYPENFDSSDEKQLSDFRLRRAMLLMEKARLYRRLRTGSIQFSLSAFDKAEQEIITLKEKTFGEGSAEILALEGRLAAGRGTVHYRQGSYEELLEFYLQGELEEALDLFTKQSQGSPFETAERLLMAGKEKLEQAQRLWKDGKKEAEELRGNTDKWLAATYYRIGELKWLQEKFEGADGAFKYLKDSIELCNKIEYFYRKFSAMESYVTAYYFYKKFSDDFDDDCKKYIREIEAQQEKHPVILAKLRITQGDEIFSRLFERSEDDADKEKGPYRDVHYVLRKEIARQNRSASDLPKDVNKQLRTMVSYYVEACSLMKKTEIPRNFSIAVRVLTRRVRLLNDVVVQEKVYSILQEMWKEYEELKNSQDKLRNILEFSRILNGLAKKPAEEK